MKDKDRQAVDAAREVVRAVAAQARERIREDAGAAMVLNKHAQTSLEDTTGMRAVLRAEEPVVVISAYAPHAGRMGREKEF